MPEPSSGDTPTSPARRRAAGLDGMVLAELQRLASGLGITGTGGCARASCRRDPERRRVVRPVHPFRRIVRRAAGCRAGRRGRDRERTERVGTRARRSCRRPARRQRPRRAHRRRSPRAWGYQPSPRRRLWRAAAGPGEGSAGSARPAKARLVTDRSGTRPATDRGAVQPAAATAVRERDESRRDPQDRDGQGQDRTDQQDRRGGQNDRRDDQDGDRRPGGQGERTQGQRDDDEDGDRGRNRRRRRGRYRDRDRDRRGGPRPHRGRAAGHRGRRPHPGRRHPRHPRQLRVRPDLRLPARTQRRLRLAGPGAPQRPAQGRRRHRCVRQPREGERQQKFNALVRLDTVNGADPEARSTGRSSPSSRRSTRRTGCASRPSRASSRRVSSTWSPRSARASAV